LRSDPAKAILESNYPGTHFTALHYWSNRKGMITVYEVEQGYNRTSYWTIHYLFGRYSVDILDESADLPEDHLQVLSRIAHWAGAKEGLHVP
jgi:hypothetical protein